jgi:hypothetical protein
MSGFLEVERQQILDQLEWRPSDDRKLYFFECRPSSSAPPTAEAKVREGFLEHDEVQSWLQQMVRRSSDPYCVFLSLEIHGCTTSPNSP